MADAEEIQEAIDAATEGGCKELVVLHCVSGYPAAAEDYNLKTIVDMQRRFNVLVGISDHTLDTVTAIASIALGVCIVKKHVTLNRNGGGSNDSFSLESDELKALCEGVKTAWQAIGAADYGRKSSEQGNIKFRRSLYFVEKLKSGEIIREEHIRSIRPRYGVSPKYYNEILGKKVKNDIDVYTSVFFDDLE